MTELDRIGQERSHNKYQGQDLGAMDMDQMEHVLADTVLKEFKVRLGRIGLDYQTPAAP